jgi:hypothetical protein
MAHHATVAELSLVTAGCGRSAMAATKLQAVS